jgi:hypothetical protein
LPFKLNLISQSLLRNELPFRFIPHSLGCYYPPMDLSLIFKFYFQLVDSSGKGK